MKFRSFLRCAVVYFYVDVKNTDTGRVENWAFEMGAPSVISRQGWAHERKTAGRTATLDRYS